MFCQGECCGFAEDPVPKGGYGFTTDDIFYLEVSSEVIKGHQRPPEAIRGHLPHSIPSPWGVRTQVCIFNEICSNGHKLFDLKVGDH